MTLRKTPFHAHHREAGARLVPFAGYEMPVQYSGVIMEHLAVRQAVGLFDLSHMGEIEVRGAEASAFLDRLLTNSYGDLEEGRARYSAMCNESGGIIDDLIVYRLSGRYLLVVNASNFEKDLAWIREQAPDEVEITDVNAGIGLLAVQGPRAEDVVQRLTTLPLHQIPYYGVVEGQVAGVETVVARTGYTGEDGFELYVPADRASDTWNAVTEAGVPFGMGLVGLGARDTLRLEMKYALYGNDIDEDTTPLEAGLSWVVKLDKPFIGRDALLAQKARGVERRLVAFRVDGRGVPRPGHEVRVGGETVGTVRSGTFSPSLRMGIGTAYVRRPHTRSGTAIEVVAARGRTMPGAIVKPPFYREGSLKRG